MTTDDIELVQEYVQHRSEEAFATLVSRYVNLVYSVALRQLQNAHLAEEITQATFIILARKAGSLNSKTILSAWLCRTAQYAAADALKAQRRRQNREQEMHMESVSNQSEPDSSPWTDIAPLLDAAMAQLGGKDHSAVVLRFFEGKDLKQVGAALGVSENTAKTRVSRAVQKLRKFFVKRGIILSAAAIAGAVSANSIQAAPVGVVAAVTAVAAKGSAIAGSTLTLIEGTLKLMAWAKVKTAALAGVGVLLAAGIVIVYEGTHSNLPATKQPQTSQVSASGTFESFFQHTPNIRKLVFERIDGQKSEGLFMIRRDATNVMLFPVTQNGGMLPGEAVGWFGGFFWRHYAQPNLLVIADPRINTEVPEPPADGQPHDDGGPTGVVEHSLFKRRVGVALALGFNEIDSDSEIVWDKSSNRFTASTIPFGEPSHKVVIELRYENGVPVTASYTSGPTATSPGRTVLIQYKYSSSFCNGQMPVEFTRFEGMSGKADYPGFTVRIKELEFLDPDAPCAEMDPRQIFQAPDMRLHIWSNNVSYSQTVWGMRKVLISAEAQEQTRLFREKRKARGLPPLPDNK